MTSETLPALGVSEVAGLVVTVALLYLLAYLNILEAAEADASLRHKIAALATPLFFTFAGIVIYHSLVALRWFGIP